MINPRPQPIDISPSARRLTDSLRDVGYDFNGAIADLIDNSVSAGATHIDVTISFEGERSWVRIADDGCGMQPGTLNEALRFGTRRDYDSNELGRFGLGLKTASLSQCRRILVATRAATQRRRIHIRDLDLDHITATDRWEILALDLETAPTHLIEPLAFGSGTVVVWQKLDRVLDLANPNGGWALRRLDRLATALREHLGMVFHRFLDGELQNRQPLKMTVNEEIVQSWDPFARTESATIEMPPKTIDVRGDDGEYGTVTFRPYVLPHRSAFSSQSAFDRLSGPRKWNRQQGFYIYRAGRLVHSGGWAGLRAIDEHTKFARAAIEFEPDLDNTFKVNVAKMRVTIPTSANTQFQQPVAELCREAMQRYRRGELSNRHSPSTRGSSSDLAVAGVALHAAAIRSGDVAALHRIAAVLRDHAPEMATDLGWDS